MLELRQIVKSFGPIHALREVSLTLRAGEIRGICGENGAGKSTLMKLLMGIVRPDSGSIEIDGRRLSIERPQQAQELGIAMVAQELSLAPHLSVLDNIWLGSRLVPILHRRSDFRRRAREALRLLGADYDLDHPVRSLSMGERQIVEIARLLVRDAKILILDEPTAMLSDVEIDRMMAALRNLKAKGKAILYVTHRLGEVFEICDSVTVLRNGKEVATQRVSGTSRRELIEQMLGRPFEEMYPAPLQNGRVSLGLLISGLQVPGLVDQFSLDAPRGQITCIVGQVGSGAATIVRAVAGLVAGATGSISLDGNPASLSKRDSGPRSKFVFISDDRASEGLFRRSVLENLIAAQMPRYTRVGLLSWSKLRSLGKQLCGEITLDPSRLRISAFELSGGNQQKILFARAIGLEKEGVLLINEPTRGVDVGARAEIYRLLRQFSSSGYVTLMSSTDLDEVVGMADNVVTMYRGKAVAQYERPNIRMSALLADIMHPSGLDRVAS